MQHYLYPAPLPPPLPPPPATGGRGTILSQEARLHALQIAEEIQAERGSYRKWNEVAKAVNRQYGSNVDGDLVKRQVTSMLRSVQRSGLNSVKRPRKHAEVIQQLLDPVTKRQCGPVGMLSPGTPLRIRGSEAEGEEEGSISVEMDESDHDTGSEGGSPPTPTVTGVQAGSEKTDPSATTTTTTTTATTATTTIADTQSLLPLPTGEPTETSTVTIPTSTPSTTSKLNTATSSSDTPISGTALAKAELLKKALQNSLDASGDSHSIERVPRKKSEKHQHQSQQHQHQPHTIMMQPPMAHFAPLRILPNMSVDEVYNLVVRVHPDIDVEFIRNQEIDGMAFQTLSHKELTDFGVPTFGKRNKLLQLCISFDSQTVPPAPSGNPQDFYYGRLPAFSSGAAFIETKGEGEKQDKESSEKKPPVTKVIDLEVVGVRKRYLVERENGAVEVLTPCKLRKYKDLTSAFEHIHPDKLVPIPTFSSQFTHIPNNSSAASSDDPSKPSSSDPSATSPAATSPSSRALSAKPSTSKTIKTTTTTTTSPKQPGAFMPPTATYYPVYYPSALSHASYTVMGPSSSSPHPSGNLQWIPSPYPGVSTQRTPEKYHSFHPYNPPK